mmetsp:Transcript_1552/g.3401  ORF Transcript_1552/g.3401 Transcript_1552/m.3401 type:complete len:110 (-) Transcript_1552:109-438(-)
MDHPERKARNEEEGQRPKATNGREGGRRSREGEEPRRCQSIGDAPVQGYGEKKLGTDPYEATATRKRTLDDSHLMSQSRRKMGSASSLLPQVCGFSGFRVRLQSLPALN